MRYALLTILIRQTCNQPTITSSPRFVGSIPPFFRFPVQHLQYARMIVYISYAALGLPETVSLLFTISLPLKGRRQRLTISLGILLSFC